jgi:hypothetical protein
VDALVISSCGDGKLSRNRLEAHNAKSNSTATLPFLKSCHNLARPASISCKEDGIQVSAEREPGVARVDLNGDGSQDFLFDSQQVCGSSPGHGCSNRGCHLVVYKQFGPSAYRKVLEELYDRERFISISKNGRLNLIVYSSPGEFGRCQKSRHESCDYRLSWRNGGWVWQTVQDKERPKGFIFRSQDIHHATNPSQFVRLGEKISPQALKKRFAEYEVRYAKGEDCLTCAVISGADGQFAVSFGRDGRTIVDIRSYDGRSRDAQGNAVGASLGKAIGSTSAQCDAGMDTTCASPRLKGLSYIVAEDDRCSITVKDKQLTDIPACARIAGFQILVIDLGR